MAKIQMPDDFYEQTPDANVLATEAVMNTMRTADMLFDQIGRLLRPAPRQRGGRPRPRDPPRPRVDDAVGARRTAHRHPRHGDRPPRLARAARVRAPFREPGRPSEPGRRDHARRAGRGPGASDDRPSPREGLDGPPLRRRAAQPTSSSSTGSRTVSARRPKGPTDSLPNVLRVRDEQRLSDADHEGRSERLRCGA